MDEWIVKWANTLLSLVGISALAAASRSVLSEDRRSLAGFVRGLMLALFVGGIVGSFIQDSSFSEPAQGGIVGLSAFVADDILLLVIGIAAHLRKNPKTIIDFVLRRKQ